MSERLTLGQKLMEIQNKLVAPKNLWNDYGKYHYRSCESILEAVKPLLKEYGCHMTINDEIIEIGSRYYVRAHASIRDTESGEVITNTAYAREPESKKGADEAQITGATSSYARKYALNGLFLIDDTKDADTNENRNERDNRAQAKQDDPKIGAQQIDNLVAFANEVGISIEQICTTFKIGSLQDMTMSMWVQATKMLEKTQQKKGAAA